MTVQPLNFSTRDVEAAQAVLLRATAGEATSVVTLTDEEIVILDGLATPQIVATPWAEANSGVAPELFGQVALRALLARGDVLPATQTGSADLAIVASDEITGCLVLRRTAEAIVSVERQTSLGNEWLYYYRHEDRVLEERVDADGFHFMTVLVAEDVGVRVESFVNPTQVRTTPDFERLVTRGDAEAQIAQIPEIAQSLAVSEMAAIRAGSEVMTVVTVYVGPDGLYVMRPTRSDSPLEDQDLSLHSIDATGIQALATELVGHSRPESQE
jgi:hypothetical protein